jgi:catechol 2,3-dioxygenase-like lactoylglutathione lyase family enzyme
LCYFAGDPADQAAAFEVASSEDLALAAAELERCGHAVTAGTAAEAESRKVRAFIAFDDPSGNRIELVVRPEHNGRGYHLSSDAGITGFSHIGIEYSIRITAVRAPSAARLAWQTASRSCITGGRTGGSESNGPAERKVRWRVG